MGTKKDVKCKRCGAVIRGNSTEKLCPACLMSGALGRPGGAGETISMGLGESLPLYGPSEFPFEFGGYRLLGLLGRGGMGTVYEAEQISLGRHVALKVLPKQMMLDKRQRQRFEREARSAARLHHSNIVPVFGVGEQDGMHYYHAVHPRPRT